MAAVADAVRERQSAVTDALVGSIAGVAATVAMTLAADSLFRRLPAHERYPLPPRELTERSARAVRLAGPRDEEKLRAATLASHFGFGAATGSLYALLLLKRSPPAVPAGIAFGLAVWAASYLGWIPASGLLRPASRHPARRNRLMLAVHVVWGGTLGLVADRLSRSLAPIAGGPLADR